MTLLNTPDKARVIADYERAWRCRSFIETGTGHGVLTNALALIFDRIFSVERDAELARQARIRCEGWDNIEIFTGRSEEFLPSILEAAGPNVIFLDAHANTLPEGEAEGALAAELDIISAGPWSESHVILIDDARLCRDDHGWVSLEGIKEWAGVHGMDFELKDDIVRLTP